MRLAERMAREEAALKKNRVIRIEYYAAAAALGAILISAWFFFKPDSGKLTHKAPVQKNLDTAVVKAIQEPDSVVHQRTESALAEVLDSELETAVTTSTSSVQATPANAADAAIAAELEEAGLIVLEIEDGIFDPIDIAP